MRKGHQYTKDADGKRHDRYRRSTAGIDGSFESQPRSVYDDDDYKRSRGDQRVRESRLRSPSLLKFDGRSDLPTSLMTLRPIRQTNVPIVLELAEFILYVSESFVHLDSVCIGRVGHVDWLNPCYIPWVGLGARYWFDFSHTPFMFLC